MPYIKQEDRQKLDPLLEEITQILAQTMPMPGQLNYVITRICHAYLGVKPDYALFNDVMGVLNCATHELYRRKVSPYEDKKIEENGDL
jgi:hypothetical protein